MGKLDLDISDEEDLNINESYASNYNQWREKEELQKLKDRYGNPSENETSSETEDDCATQLTPQVDEEWMRLYATAKFSTAELYNKDLKFFEKQKSEGNEHKPTKKREKPLLFKDYERRRILNGEEPQDAYMTEIVPGSYESLRDYWQSEKISENDKFLRDYLLNRKYLVDEDDNDTEYKLNSSDSDSAEEDKQDEFEKNYNFRFEEPDGCQIKSYPRKITDSVRPVDHRRSEARLKAKERKETRENKKREELKRLRSLQRKEEAAKVSKLRSLSGNQNFDTSHVFGDFDPEEHDQQEIFGDNFYNIPFKEKKPKFSSSEDEALENLQSKRALRREAVKTRMMVPEDIIPPPPNRFSYRNVSECDFGLSLEEILNADYKELNQWVSLKKMVQYRTDEEEYNDKKMYEKRRKKHKLKRHIFKSLKGIEQNQEVDDAVGNGQHDSTIDASLVKNESNNAEKNMKTKRKISNNGGLNDDRLFAYGFDPKKFRHIQNAKKRKKSYHGREVDTN
ncbi:protein KRI1 homolog [Octopus sinensis]|uniref:Protein KRI1 homolog n=1 Tax=Octopus sinensis TaxID=2607531 RepID=A0A7E6EJE4_9MOLL|nr:protein KRI1 homolog [Octopus sinensis]